MDEPPPEKRTSTPVATEATQATAAGYQGKLVSSIDLETWMHVDRNTLLAMIYDKLENKTYRVKQGSGTHCELQSDEKTIILCDSDKDMSGREKSEQKAPGLRQKLRDYLKMKQRSRKAKCLKMEHLIYLVDVGGQVQFQENQRPLYICTY